MYRSTYDKYIFSLIYWECIRQESESLYERILYFNNNIYCVLILRFLREIFHTYFSPCSGSFVLSGEYIQYSPLINFGLIIPSNIHLQLIIPSNIHLQCLCSTKNEKKTSRRQFGIESYFYSESLTQPRSVKNKYVILRHLWDMCLFTSALRASVNKSHIPSLPQNNLYLNITTPKQFEPSICWVLICISNIFCEWETKEEWLSQIDVE
jgi:hypothetical protein